HMGYNASFKGHAPIAGYAFYYLNRPEFLRDNLTLRMAIAPVYFDSELGISHALGPNTDIGIGVAGGAFADSFNEVRQGKYLPKESFDGYGGSTSVNLYHRFNPAQRIPLFGIARAGVHYVTYADTDDTAGNFELPDDRASANFRVGLRLGGKEPVLFPSVAMELAVWAESLNRASSGHYGFNNDREVNSSAHLFYTFAYLAYTFERGDNLSVSMTGGDSVDADRFSAYRLGGVLPLVAEYPLVIPGYYYQEITARRFLLFNGRYAVALDEKKRWSVNVMAASAVVQYLHGFKQPGDWHSGVGGGIGYQSQSEIWKAAVNYGYGIDAIRHGDRGAHVVSLVLQFDLEKYLYKERSKAFWWE
ncbi:MAG TPA: hypothetical protein VK846_03195, partial [Candidatus Limnocylindria bacterium]|nr:hypothetical protein [Candidatus Limnocylindria bacterium]